jgi:hypothetical protein
MRNKTHVYPIDVIVDFDQFGEIIGVEIISLLVKVGKRDVGNVPSSFQAISVAPTYSYDRDVDCFYLRMKSAKSYD